MNSTELLRALQSISIDIAETHTLLTAVPTRETQVALIRVLTNLLILRKMLGDPDCSASLHNLNVEMRLVGELSPTPPPLQPD